MTGAYIERGQSRLDNWRRWSRRDSLDHLNFPTMSTIRRNYRPELGNVWDGEPERDLFDEQDALAIEHLVNGLPSLTRDIIIARYLWLRQLNRMEEEFRLPRWRLRSIIEQVELLAGRACSSGF